MKAAGAKRAGRSTKSRRAVAKAERLQRRLATAEDELRRLAELNGVLIDRMAGDPSVAGGIFVAEFDMTDPAADACVVRRKWRGEIQGDFHFVRRLGRSIYFVVGDATGHHAHAGGLKLFAVTGLVLMFEAFARDKAQPEPIEIVQRLDEWFSTQANGTAKQAGLSGGANLIVVRIDATPRRAVIYTSAGLPVHALGQRFEQHGSFGDFNGVGFCGDGAERDPIRKSDVIDVGGVGFLAIVTDGFRALGRRPRATGGARGNGKDPEQFGDHGVEAALLQGCRSAGAAASPAGHIAGALTAEARRFRRGYSVPEDHDDHRLVLVVDLNAIWTGAASSVDEAAPPLVAEGQAGLLELRRGGKKLGKLTKCLP